MQNLDVLMKSVYTWTYVHWVPRLLFLLNICRIWWTGYIMIYQPSRTIYQPTKHPSSLASPVNVIGQTFQCIGRRFLIVFFCLPEAKIYGIYGPWFWGKGLDAKTCWKMSKVKWCDVVTPCLQSLCRFLILQQGLLAYHAKNPVTVVNW